MTSLYREILRRAWYITRKYAYLWPLGFFVSFLGNTGEYQALINQIRQVQNQPEAASNLRSSLFSFVSALPDLNLNFSRGLLLFLFIVMIIGLAGLLAWIVISSVGGLISGSYNAGKDKRDNFVSLVSHGSHKFWPVFSLFLIAKVIIYGFLAFILMPFMLATYMDGNYALNNLIAFLIILIFVPITIIVSFVTRYASAYVVLKGQKMWDAFKNGWKLFAANWLISLEMAAILLLLNFALALAILIVSFLLFSPFFFVSVVSAFQNPDSFLSIISIPLFIIVLLTIILGSIFAAFQMSSWTLLFTRLTESKGAYSKIVRLVSRLSDKFKRKPAL